MAKAKSKRVVIRKAQQEGRTVHVPKLMDLCHLEHSEVVAKSSKHTKVALSSEVTDVLVLTLYSRNKVRQTHR